MRLITKNRAKINYFVDVVIGLAFVLAGVSGLVLFFVGGSKGGYMGGRNPNYSTAIAGLSRTVWKDLHDWSGIIMMVSVLGHLVLHFNWFACMTRNLFRRMKTRRPKQEACEITN